jgi:hypothetical protein
MWIMKFIFTMNVPWRQISKFYGHFGFFPMHPTKSSYKIIIISGFTNKRPFLLLRQRGNFLTVPIHTRLKHRVLVWGVVILRPPKNFGVFRRKKNVLLYFRSLFCNRNKKSGYLPRRNIPDFKKIGITPTALPETRPYAHVPKKCN